MNKNLIHLENINKQYVLCQTPIPVLKNVTLSIKEGEMVAIVGASGSGKTTLMNIIGLLDKQDQGDYYLQGQAINHLSQDALAELRNKAIGFVFQQFHLLPRLSAIQNIALPLSYRIMPKAAIKLRVEDALQRVQMQAYGQRKPMQLSGGQQQRIAIARALVTHPHLILADEPTGALDSRTGESVMQLFLELHQEGRTIIIVTHDEKIAQRCQRKIVIADGEIKETGQ